MKSPIRIAVVLIAVCLFSHSAHAQKSRRPAQPKKPTATAVKAAADAQTFSGAVENGAYVNSFFGLKIAVPENWIIQEKAVNDEIKQLGDSGVKGKTRAAQQSFDRAAQRVTILMTATRDIIGIADNAIFGLAVEKPLPPLRIRNGEDYLRLTLQSYKFLQQSPGQQVKVSETIRSETLGGEAFHYIDVQQNGFTQRFYATARKGYAVFFLLQFSKTEDLETMKEALRNSDFRWNG